MYARGLSLVRMRALAVGGRRYLDTATLSGEAKVAGSSLVQRHIVVFLFTASWTLTVWI